MNDERELPPSSSFHRSSKSKPRLGSDGRSARVQTESQAGHARAISVDPHHLEAVARVLGRLVKQSDGDGAAVLAAEVWVGPLVTARRAGLHANAEPLLSAP